MFTEFIYMYTAILRKVVGNNVHATIPKGNMGYDQYTVPDNVAVEPTFVDFLYHSQTYDLLFFQISLKNSKLQTTHNTFWACRMYFIQQPSSKQLFISSRGHCKMMLVLQMSIRMNFILFLNSKLSLLTLNVRVVQDVIPSDIVTLYLSEQAQKPTRLCPYP